MLQSSAWMGVNLSESANACLLCKLAGCATKHTISICCGFLENMSYTHYK